MIITNEKTLSVCLDTNEKLKLFYYLVYFYHYSVYFCYYSWVPLYFFILFMGPLYYFK